MKFILFRTASQLQRKPIQQKEDQEGQEKKQFKKFIDIKVCENSLQETSLAQLGIWEDCHIRSSKERSLLYIGSSGFWGPILNCNFRKVIVFVMKAMYSPHVRNGHVCKDKWETSISDFKKTYDYMAKIGHNEKY